MKSLTFASIILTWLYNSTRGSLLMVIVFHAFFDWLSVSDAGGQYAAMIMGATAVAWAVFVMVRYGAADLALVKKQVHDLSVKTDTPVTQSLMGEHA